MSTNNPPRYLPTLTEVVLPEVAPHNIAGATQATGPDDTAAITQSVLAKITPLLEQQLRSSAQELFEVQISVVLPALHRHIEAVVRQAVQETLVERGAEGASGPSVSNQT